MTVILQSLFDWRIPFTLIEVFLRYRDPCIYYSAFYILYQMRFSQQIVREFEDSAHWAMFALIDFKRLDFAFAFFAFWISNVQALPLLSSFGSGVQT